VTPGTPDPGESQRLGLAAYRQGRRAEAAERLRSAVEEFRRRGDGLQAAEAANNLSVVLLQAGQAREALEAVQGTAAVFQRAGDGLREAQAIGNEAAALEGVGRLDEAERKYREAVDKLHRLQQSEAEAQTWHALSAMLLRRGRPLEAAASAEAGLQAAPPSSWGRRWAKRILRALARFRPS